MQSQSQEARQQLRQSLSQSGSPHDHPNPSPGAAPGLQQDAASHFLQTAQQHLFMGSHSPLSASASADQTGSGYQSSSAQSASEDPILDSGTASSSVAGSRRPSSLGRKASEGSRGQKHRWSAEETQALVDGCNKHGVGNWKKILSDPELSGLFSDRTAGDLKDRFRTYFPDAYHEMYPNAKTHLSKAVRGRDSDGKSIFEKGKTKERRPFTAEEDAALRAGYQHYGSHWALIAKDPIFNGQRRAIDLRDRFRNAFPEDYERAGFKPRPSKARKDRGPSASKPGQGHAARSGPFSDHSHSEGGNAWRSTEYPLSDTTSDGHLTDHGNLTDYSYFTDQGNLTDGGADAVFSGPSSGTSSALGRSNSMGHGVGLQISSQAAMGETMSFGQALSLQQQQQQQQQQQAFMQARPPFMSSNTAPLPGANLPLRVTDMVTGQSINSLFEQLEQASLEGTGTSSETSSVHGRATPPSASEGDVAQQQRVQQMHQQTLSSSHTKAVSADDARRQAGKQASHDGVSHKRRSHASRTGKNSALERLPSVHGHLHHMHGHAHGHSSSHSNPHSRPLSQSSSQHHSPAGGAVPLQSDPRLSPLGHADYVAQPDVLAWLNPAGQNMLPQSASMDMDGPSGQVPSSWSAYSSSASDVSGASLGSVDSRGFSAHQQPIFGTGINFANQAGFTSPPHPGSIAMLGQGVGSASGSSASSATGSRRSSETSSSFVQQQQMAQTNAKSMPDRQATLRGNYVNDPMQSFVDSFSAHPADASQWNVDWDLGSFSDSGLQTQDVNELLASLPLPHHPWAGDLQHGVTAADTREQTQQSTNFGDVNAAQMSSEQRNQLNNTENASGPSAIGQGKAAEDALLRQMNALGALPQQQQQQQAGQQPSSGNAAGSSSNNDGGVSFATVTYGDPLLREEREGSPDSLELQREQTFTAKDVGKRFSRDRQDDDKDLAESDDDQRRRSTDTLRRVEGALEQALESVEDTRALAFAQQFQRDVDSDEDSDDEEEADEDGYEEDEEDDNEPDYEQDGAEYNFQQVLDDMQASDPQLSGQGAFSSDFFDGPFDDGMGATPGALGPSALAGGDLSLYPNLDRSMAGSAQNAAQMTSSSAGFSHSAPLDGMQGTGDAAAAAGLMNQMWNAGVPLGLHQQSQTASGAGSMAYAGNANMFANVQSTGWGSSPGGHSSPINGLNAGLGDGSIRGSPGQGNASFNQQQ